MQKLIDWLEEKKRIAKNVKKLTSDVRGRIVAEEREEAFGEMLMRLQDKKWEKENGS